MIPKIIRNKAKQEVALIKELAGVEKNIAKLKVAISEGELLLDRILDPSVKEFLETFFAKEETQRLAEHRMTLSLDDVDANLSIIAQYKYAEKLGAYPDRIQGDVDENRQKFNQASDRLADIRNQLNKLKE